MVDAVVLAPCKEIIERTVSLTSAENDACLQINKQQCKLLVKKLSETQTKLDRFRDVLHEETIDRHRIFGCPDLVPAIKEIHRVLGGSETLIKDCCCNDQWLMAAIRQGDMKETFAKILYDLQWCTSVLCSILLKSMAQDSSNVLGPAECNGNLGAFDYFDLSAAAKQDQEDLKVSLYDLKADHICGAQSCDQHLTEQCLAAKLVAKLDAEALHIDNGSDLSTSPLFLWVNEQHLPDGERLGRGGFGEVRETRWFGETYAKKTCHVDLKQFFNQELGALARLHHPHVVRLVCCCKDKRTFSLVMERMDKSLFEHLEEYRAKSITRAVPFSHLRAVDLMLQVAEGMRYIHNKKLVHRDLKSPNILINFSRDSYIAKVTDFGMTKIKNASTAHQTRNIGSTTWMAPEVFELAEGEVRPSRFHPMKMDVYSFGIVCWEVLTGEVPFEHEQNRSQLKRRVKMGMRPKLPPDCPTSLADLIQRCWDGNPRLRPDFPEICMRLRYIKGRLLQADQEQLLKHVERPIRIEVLKSQGPYGYHHSGSSFYDGLSTGIRAFKLWLSFIGSRKCLASFQIEYDLQGKSFYSVKHGQKDNNSSGDESTGWIKFNYPDEYLVHVEGSTSVFEDIGSNPIVTSLTFTTNLTTYGPFGYVNLENVFGTDFGKVLGFFGSSASRFDTKKKEMFPKKIDAVGVFMSLDQEYI